MWTCSLLKQNAKQCLARNTVSTLLVVLAYTALTGRLVEFVFSSRNIDWGKIFSPSLVLLILGGSLLFTALSALYAIFVKNPLEIGLNRYFMEARIGTPPFGTLFGGFHSGDYGRITYTMFMTKLKIFLYSLLLVIPGIIKGYSLMLVPYLLAENPQMDRHRAQELSEHIMYGEKWNVFILELSFIGWIILCSIASVFLFRIFFLLGFIASIFFETLLSSYMLATKAEFYAAMREKAFARAYTTPAELGGFITY